MRPAAIRSKPASEEFSVGPVGGHAGRHRNNGPQDAEENELAIGRELRILSSYGDGEDDDRL